jgi:hypothetical protein
MGLGADLPQDRTPSRISAGVVGSMGTSRSALLWSIEQAISAYIRTMRCAPCTALNMQHLRVKISSLSCQLWGPGHTRPRRLARHRASPVLWFPISVLTPALPVSHLSFPSIAMFLRASRLPKGDRSVLYPVVWHGYGRLEPDPLGGCLWRLAFPWHLQQGGLLHTRTRPIDER